MPAPAISVVMATRDRRELLDVALRCFEDQRGVNAELIVVDDSETPRDTLASDRVRVLRVAPDTPLGAMMNAGATAARGRYLAKWDDDGYYGPDYLRRQYAFMRTTGAAVTFVQPFTIHHLLTDRLYTSGPYRRSDATLFLSRYLWTRCPFRPVPRDVDGWLLNDVIRRYAGDKRVCRGLPLASDFVQLRHADLADGELTVDDVAPAWVTAVWAAYRDRIAVGSR